MRRTVCALVGLIALTANAAAAPRAPARPAQPQLSADAARFWRDVQRTCDATAAKGPSEFGRRVAQVAIDEFTRFDGHRIDSNGRLYSFGLTEAEHEEEVGGDAKPKLGQLGWWLVTKYWRALFAPDSFADKLEVRGFEGASNGTNANDAPEAIHTSAARLMALADAATDPGDREALREAALRAAAVDTPWSAAFISYVLREAGASAAAFRFSNAHRAYIYEALAATLAETTNKTADKIYRACPFTTRPRPGDIICHQRESAYANVSDAEVRERMRQELVSGAETRSVRRTHCDVIGHVDVRGRAAYGIGGNVYQAVTARKFNLRRGSLRLLADQKGHCGGKGEWTLPKASADVSGAPVPAGASGTAPAAASAPHEEKCSLTDWKWFVLLQVR